MTTESPITLSTENGTGQDVRIDEYGTPTTSVKEALREVSKSRGPAKDEPETAEPDKPSIDDHLRQAARAFGYSDEELDSTSPETLQSEIARMDRRVLALLSQQQQSEQRHAPPEPQHSTQPTQQQQLPPIDWKKLEDEYDEGIVAPLKLMHDRMEQMQSMLQQYEQVMYSQQTDSFTRWFDAQLPELGDAYVQVLGKGTINDLNPNSAEYRARMRLEEAFGQLRQIDQHSSDDALLKRAAYAAFPEVTEAQHRKQLADELKKRQKSTIGRPAGRRAQVTESDDRDPMTGVSRQMVDKVQDRINRMKGL